MLDLSGSCDDATLARLIRRCPSNASHAAIRARRFCFLEPVPVAEDPSSMADAVFRRLTVPH